VAAGTGRYTINGRRYDVEPGDLLCTPPGSTREARTSPDRLLTVYAADFHLLPPGQATLPLGVKTNIGRRKELIRTFSELNFTWMEKQPGYGIKCQGLLLLILHRVYELCVLAREFAEDDYRIRKAARYIAAHYTEKLTVEKMAAMTNLQPHYFNALFKQQTGLSMHQYLIKTRIKNAYNMLVTGEYKVAEIAEICGYSDIYHFHKQFKTVMNISPSQCIPRG
jgi:AraC-like DNA-binding protein